MDAIAESALIWRLQPYSVQSSLDVNFPPSMKHPIKYT